MRPRSEGVILDHGPVSNAARAALTARSMSSLSPSATRDRTSPVAGLYVGNVFAEGASTHLPLMRILCVRATNFETFWSSSGAYAVVAIFRSPSLRADAGM